MASSGEDVPENANTGCVGVTADTAGKVRKNQPLAARVTREGLHLRSAPAWALACRVC